MNNNNPIPATPVEQSLGNGQSIEALTPKSTAYHEAGHLVVALAQGLVVKLATIVPEPGMAGHIAHIHKLPAGAPLSGEPLRPVYPAAIKTLPREGIRMVEDEIRVCMAGMLARERYLPYVSDDLALRHGIKDLSRSLHLLLYLYGDANHADKTFNGPAVLRTLADQTCALLDRHWQQVTAFAQALLEHRTLERWLINLLWEASGKGK